jgi:predicted O-methyltransferase YrrM
MTGFSPAHNRFGGPPESPAEMWRLLDLITPMALRVAATLRLADRLASGPLPVGDLAEQAGADPAALHRMLRYLAARGVFEVRGEVVALNPAAGLLRDDHPAGVRRWADLDGFGGVLDRAGLGLLDIVRAGHTGFAGHRDALDGERGASYDAAMQALSRMQAPEVVAAIDWTGVEHVVDVGGGTGTLLAAALHAVPGMRGTLVELPETAEAARRMLEADGLADRATVLGGDVTQLALPAADRYLLKFVLHTMDDAPAQAVLRRVAEAGGPASRVLVVERVMGPPDPHGAVFTSMDLRMLALGNGQERALEEYDTLAATAGLTRTRLHHTPTGPSVLEYAPPR